MNGFPLLSRCRINQRNLILKIWATHSFFRSQEGMTCCGSLPTGKERITLYVLGSITLTELLFEFGTYSTRIIFYYRTQRIGPVGRIDIVQVLDREHSGQQVQCGPGVGGQIARQHHRSFAAAEPGCGDEEQATVRRVWDIAAETARVRRIKRTVYSESLPAPAQSDPP